MANQVAPFANQTTSLDFRKRFNLKYDGLQVVNGFKAYYLDGNYSYHMDSENLVVLPIWNIMVNHSLGNLSVDPSAKQPPKKTLSILIEQLENNGEGEYFAAFRDGKRVPVAYIYDTVTKHDVMVYSRRITPVMLVNQYHNTSLNLMMPVDVGNENSIKVSGNVVDDQANTQALIKRLPYKIERYDLSNSTTVNLDFEALGKLL